MELLYQVRIHVSEPDAVKLREGVIPNDLDVILKEHDASLVCQYDAFSGYCEEAEQEGVEGYHLYEWTKSVIDNPVKREKYLKNFTVYVEDEQLYSEEIADSLYSKLSELELIESIKKYSNDPAANPQPPK